MVRFIEVDVAYVISDAVILAALVLNYIAVRLKGCGYDDARGVIITRSF